MSAAHMLNKRMSLKNLDMNHVWKYNIRTLWEYLGPISYLQSFTLSTITQNSFAMFLRVQANGIAKREQSDDRLRNTHVGNGESGSRQIEILGTKNLGLGKDVRQENTESRLTKPS